MDARPRQNPSRRADTRCLFVSQEGMVLISSLLILASVSLLAFGLAGDSTTELRIAGNRRLHEQAFDLADGGTNVGVQALLDCLNEAVDPDVDYPDSATAVELVPGALYLRNFQKDSTLRDDIMGYNGPTPGTISFALSSSAGGGDPSDSSVTIEIQRLSAKLLAGSSIEFAAGYEGVGKGAGTGSIGVYYSISGLATTPAQSTTPARSEVATVFRKVSNVIAGAQ